MKAYSSITISAIFAILIVLIPWEELRGAAFVDKAVYLDYAYYQTNVLDYRVFDSFLSYISFEWLWHYLLLNINDFIAYETFFNTISFFTLALMSYFLVRRHGALSILLLLNPLVIDLAMSQYRISLALILIMLASVLIQRYKKLSILLVLIATLIHSSVAIFIVIYIAIKIISKLKFKQQYIEVLLLSLLGLTLSFLMSDFVGVILTAIGDRRAGYAVDNISSSLSYLSFWILNTAIVIFNYCMLGVKNTKDKLTIVILSLVSGHAVFGGYSTRIIAVFLAVIMSTNLDISRQLRLTLIPVYVLYTLLQWSYWFQ